jgi:hypothetical protein
MVDALGGERLVGAAASIVPHTPCLKLLDLTGLAAPPAAVKPSASNSRSAGDGAKPISAATAVKLLDTLTSIRLRPPPKAVTVGGADGGKRQSKAGDGDGAVAGTDAAASAEGQDVRKDSAPAAAPSATTLMLNSPTVRGRVVRIGPAEPSAELVRRVARLAIVGSAKQFTVGGSPGREPRGFWRIPYS